MSTVPCPPVVCARACPGRRAPVSVPGGRPLGRTVAASTMARCRRCSGERSRDAGGGGRAPGRHRPRHPRVRPGPALDRRAPRIGGLGGRLTHSASRRPGCSRRSWRRGRRPRAGGRDRAGRSRPRSQGTGRRPWWSSGVYGRARRGGARDRLRRRWDQPARPAAGGCPPSSTRRPCSRRRSTSARVVAGWTSSSVAPTSSA